MGEAWLAFAPHAPDALFSLCSFSSRAGGSGRRVLRAVPRRRRAPRRRCSRRCAGSRARADDRQLLLPRRPAPLGGLPRARRRRSATSSARRRPGTLRRDDLLRQVGLRQRAAARAAGFATIVECDRAAPRTTASARARSCSTPTAARSTASPPDATAFVHRDALCSGQYLAHWTQPVAAPRALAVAARLLRGDAALRLGLRLPELHRRRPRRPGSTPTTGPTTRVSRRSRRDVDPAGLFRFAQAITPH